MMKRFITILVIIFALLIGMAGADPFRGTMLDKSITVGSGLDITANGGDSDLDYSASTGNATFYNLVVLNAATYGTLVENGVINNATYVKNAFYVRNATALNATTVTSLRTSAAAYAATTLGVGGITSLNATTTTTLRSSGAVYDASTLNVAGISALNATTATTLGTTGLASLLGGVKVGVNGTMTINTTFTSADPDTIFPIDASSTNKTITIPTAASMSGRVISVPLVSDPGTHYAKITATSGNICGSTVIQSTTARDGIILYSDGSNYYNVGSMGGFAAGTA